MYAVGRVVVVIVQLAVGDYFICQMNFDYLLLNFLASCLKNAHFFFTESWKGRNKGKCWM